MFQFWKFGMLLILGVQGHALPAPAEPAEGGTGSTVEIRELPDRVRVEIGGKLFTEYFFKNVPRPYCYPLIGPGGAAMTRNWPLQVAPNEEHDHPHHRSFWFAHGAVNGFDFWTEGANCGKIVHEKFREIRSGNEFGLVVSEDSWQAPDGTVVCRDTRTLRISAPKTDQERIFDFEISIHASHGQVRLGDTKEGTMAFRLAETMRVKGATGTGHIVNSNGDKDDRTWGKRAEWCDYYGSVQDKVVGIAIFDHPQNPRYPTWWHVRDYGLFAANPFGKHDFEKLADKTAGDLVIPAGQSITFRYRFYLHAGDERQGAVAARYKAYVSTTASAK